MSRAESTDNVTLTPAATPEPDSAESAAVTTPESGIAARLAPTVLAPTALDGIQDQPAQRLRYPADLIGAIACAVSLILVCLLIVYAGHTTQGITADVQDVANWFKRLISGPILALRAVLVLFVPVTVAVSLLLRRHHDVLLMSVGAALAGLLVNTLLALALDQWAPPALFRGLAFGYPPTISLVPYAAALTAMLVASTLPSRRRSQTAAWALLWVTVGVDILSSRDTLGSMGLSLLTGCMIGLTARYCVGVPSERAYGQALIDALSQIGFAPATLDRAVTPSDPEEAGWFVRSQVPQFFADHRLYALKTTSGQLCDVIVLDGDRQVLSVITRWWRQLRSRGIDPRRIASLRQSAERAALLTYSVKAVGVRTPAVLGLAEAGDSMLLVREPVPESIKLADLPPADLTDADLAAMWDELGQAHRAGLVHRGLTDQVFRIARDESGQRQLWLLGWELGDVASSDLARRIDQAQLLAMTALVFGSARAITAAADHLTADDLQAIGTLLQPPALPSRTRSQLRGQPNLLTELRQGLAERFPQAEVEPQPLARLSVRTVISVVLMAVALFVILTSFHLDQVGQALRESRWWWALASVGFGFLGMVGASLVLVAFAPVKIGLLRAWVAQLAASYVVVTVPAGIGTAGINFRFLNRKGVSGTLATATAALVQVSQVAFGLVVLVVLMLATGSSQATSFEVSPTIVIITAVVVGLVAGLFAIPKTRTWLLGKVMPTLRRTGPRLVEVVSHPGRLLLSLAGNVITLLGYALAFKAASLAFNIDLPFASNTLAYLLANSAGAVVPTPGGVGAIEAAGIAALGAAGVNPGVAASAVVVFRLATFWIRIPLGWVAYKIMERRGDL